jgi:hypothetical protein
MKPNCFGYDFNQLPKCWFCGSQTKRRCAAEVYGDDEDSPPENDGDEREAGYEEEE